GEHDVAARRIALTIGGRAGGRLTNLDLSVLQSPEQATECLRVALRLRNQECRRPGITPPCGQTSERALAQCGVRREPARAVARRLDEQRPTRLGLIAHDVAVGPRPAGPDGRIIPRRLAGIVAAPGPEGVER